MKAKRRLFGSPSTESTDKWLKESTDAILDHKSVKWQFDFRNGRPLRHQGGSKDGFVYEEMDEKKVPTPYLTRTLPSESLRSPRKRFHHQEQCTSSTVITQEETVQSTSTSVTVEVSMEYSETLESTAEATLSASQKKEKHTTPKKRQSKVTEYVPSRKNLQRNAKKSDLTKLPPVSPQKPTRSSRRIARSLCAPDAL
jgi:hypothetical protein